MGTVSELDKGYEGSKTCLSRVGVDSYRVLFMRHHIARGSYLSSTHVEPARARIARLQTLGG